MFFNPQYKHWGVIFHYKIEYFVWVKKNVNFLQVLGIMAGVLLQDHEVRYTEFQQLPYHRIFIMLFIELNAPEQILEAINFQVLTAFW